MWFRRRRRAVTSVVAYAEDDGVRILPAAPEPVAAPLPAVRVDRYVAALACHAAQLEDRIDRLERRAGDQAEAQLDRPSHDDLLDARLQSSRVSADLGRLALELRAEVAEIKEEADRAAKAALRAEDAAELAQDPDRLVELAEQLLELAEQLLELADDLDARRRAS
ncbi:MAG: hypothetical protein ABIS47_00575 [Acidimicrobiales bacterium]